MVLSCPITSDFQNWTYNPDFARGTPLILPHPSTMPPRRRKRAVSDEDSDCEAAYPTGLLDAVLDEECDSPKKITKPFVRGPLQRRQSKGRQGQKIKRGGGSKETPSPGPSTAPEWDQLDGFGDLGGPGTADADAFVEASPLDTVPTSVVVFTEEDISNYGEAVDDFTAHFTCIENRLFVVEGWDIQKRKCTVRLMFTRYCSNIAKSHPVRLVSFAVPLDRRRALHCVYLPPRNKRP